MSWPMVLGLAAAACAVTVPLVYGARRLALSAGIVDHPNARSSHRFPVPRGGGVAMVVSALAILGLIAALFPHVVRPYWIDIATGAVLVAAISAVDDWRGLPAVLRLIVHIAAALLVWRALGHGLETTNAWPALFGLLGVVWLVGMINAYNFMDGIDGLAASTGVVAGLAWAGLGVFAGLIDIALAGAVAAGACAAFLVFNWPPARIFMGDSGSAFLGYWFGALALVGAPHRPMLFAQGVMIMWPFVFDTATTMARRILRRENPLHAHRSHLYQRLVDAGLGHADVTRIYVVLSLVSAAAAALVNLSPEMLQVWVMTPVVSMLLLWVFVVHRERSRSAVSRSRS